MKKIWIATKDFSAVTYYRCRAPKQFCSTEDLSIELGVGLDLTKNYDAIILHGVIQPKWVQVFKDIQKRGIKIAINLDDDIFNIPDWNPAFLSYRQIERENLAWSLDNADLVIVSTNPLADVCREHMTKNFDKLRVCPNLMDWTLYKRQPKTDGPTKIMWAGSVHHEMDLKLISEPLDQIMKEYKDAVQVIFMGCLPDRFRQWMPLLGSNMATAHPTGDVTFIKPVELEDYPAILCKWKPDIGLCPLVDCKFNYSKSHNKATEFVLAGAQVVASYLPPYTVLGNTIHYAVDENLKQSAEIWYNAIKHAMKAKIDGYDTIKDRWTWQCSEKKKLWDDAFKELVC
jgi:glycosyltransferase involved in cell wall biosynthesis